MAVLRYIVLALVTAGATVACRESPVAPSSGPSLDDLAGRTSRSTGSDAGNRLLFPQASEPPGR